MIQEFRRAKRRKAPGTIPVTDAMTGRVVGRIGNLSQSGLLLIADEPLVEDALYQFQFSLPHENGPLEVEVGAHLLWIDHGSTRSQIWTGLRFLALGAEQTRRLRRWIEAPGSHYE